MENEARLLVVADGAGAWSDAFGLPFRDATVVDGDGSWELEGAFDTVVIDRRGFDPRWLDRVTSELRPVLSPKTRLLVALGGPAVDSAESPTLAGLEWDGMVLLGERPCAVLRTASTDAGPVETGALVAAAYSAATIAEAGMSRHRPRAQEIRRLAASGEARRRRSEQALLGHLAKAAAHSEKLSVELRKQVHAASQPVTVKALLRSSPTGRRVLGILGRAKRLLRRQR